MENEEHPCSRTQSVCKPSHRQKIGVTFQLYENESETRSGMSHRWFLSRASLILFLDFGNPSVIDFSRSSYINDLLPIFYLGKSSILARYRTEIQTTTLVQYLKQKYGPFCVSMISLCLGVLRFPPLVQRHGHGLYLSLAL